MYQHHSLVMTYDVSMNSAAFLLALLFGSVGLDFFVAPRGAQAGFVAFPRHRLAALVLAGVALVWAAWLINKMQLGFLDAYKNSLFFLTPVTYFLVIHYLDELLAPRALGGLMMMLPTVLLDAARWHESSWRFVLIVTAYLLVIAGVWLTLCPFRFRHWARPLVDSESLTRKVGAGAIALALLFAGIGLFVS